jgi:hypothetical protein
MIVGGYYYYFEPWDSSLNPSSTVLQQPNTNKTVTLDSILFIRHKEERIMKTTFDYQSKSLKNYKGEDVVVMPCSSDDIREHQLYVICVKLDKIIDLLQNEQKK